jgi:hypothetical protein
MPKRKRIDPVKQREKRSKIAAGVGVVLLVVVGAYEVPKIMSQMNPKVPPAAKIAAATDPVATGSTPVANVPATSALADTDVPPAAASAGTLGSLDGFQTKNPFKPQMSSTPALPSPTQPSSTQPSAANKPGADVPGPPSIAAATKPTLTTPLTPPAVPTTAPAPAAPAVRISVNATVSRVTAHSTFPTGAPVFRLVSWQRGSAKISIVGGSYADGGQTLTLLLNRPVTLKNTQDGTRYKLVLLSVP